MSGRYHFKIGEIALLLGLVAALLWGAWSLQAQDALGEKVIRLHVLANSDTEEDQVLKLKVRDRVLAATAAALEDSGDRRDAWRVLTASLPAIEAEARAEIRRQGYDYSVRAALEATEFPTRTYDGFALPTGQYLALRILIGEAAGRNWWCVVYPPLCTVAATDLETVALTAGMGTEDVALMQEAEGYELKFRSVELWESLRQWLSKK